MKRIIALALIVGVSSIGLVGCDQKTEEKTKTEVNGPGGSDKKEIKVEETKTGNQRTDR